MKTNNNFSGSKKRDKRYSKRKAAPNATERQDAAYEESKAHTTGINDMAWYDANPSLTLAAASIPFPYRPGMELGKLADSVYTDVPRKPTTLPGVMALQWAPSIGQSASSTDPASVAAKELYAKVRAVFSGSIDADPPDFIIYLMALDSIFSYISFLKRVYKTVNAYTSANLHTPDSLLTAMGLTTAGVQSARANMPQLLFYINQLIGMTQRFRCPAIFPLFNRHFWLSENVFSDDASLNSQLYLFKQEVYLKLEFAADEAGVRTSQLSPVHVEPFSSIDAMYTFGRSLVEALADGDDCYLISGYLSKAFDGVPDFSVSAQEAGEILEIRYVPEVLQQIENSATVYPHGGQSIDAEFVRSLTITQDVKTNTVKARPHVPAVTSLNKTVLAPALSIRAEVPSVIDVVESSRLAAYVDLSQYDSITVGTVTTKYYLIECGSEIPIVWMYYAMGKSILVDNVTTGVAVSQIADTQRNPQVKVELDASELSALTCVAPFDWAPRIVLRVTANDRSGLHDILVWDTHNVTTPSLRDMANIHRVCLLSEFSAYSGL